MQLKTLQIQGFKSFPDKTTLDFDRGITVVVGPNGSGKSNLSDAVGWVLGEQSVRSLRGEKMEDVIFLGSASRRASGFASVALTFDNSDRQLPVEQDQVTISRKLYRSGESEYRINGAAVRLKDINELLMDTGLGRDGYSLIGQGRIDEIVSVKSSQRREIFEEAAGISKYRYRKEEAEKRLSAAYENLLRLKDILSELEQRVEPLRLQAQKAQAFLALAQEKKELEVSLWVDSLGQLQQRLEEQSAAALEAKNHLSDSEAILEEYAARLQDAYKDLQSCSVSMEEQRQRMEELANSAAKADSSIALVENDILHNSRSIHDLTVELSRFGQNQDVLQQALAQNRRDAEALEEKLSALRQESQQVTEALETLEQQLKGSREQSAALRAHRGTLEQRIAQQKLSQATSATLLEEMQRRLGEQEQSRALRRQNQESLLQEQQENEKLLAAIAQREKTLENSKQGCALKAQSRKKQLEQLRERQRQLQSEAQQRQHQAGVLQDMERSMEGFQTSVKQVMNAGRSGRLQGIHGTVSQLISTEKDYALAIETALGGSMQSIVVENEASAKAAIQALKASKGGRATFLPLNVIKAQQLRERLEGEEGFCGVAAQLVESQARYRAIVENLLGRIVVAKDIDCAVALGRKYRYAFRIVTLDGQLVNAGGSMTGGSTVRNAGLLSRRGEIQRLQQEATALTAESQALEPKIKEVQQALGQVEALEASLDAQLRSAGEDRITAQSELRRIAAALEELARSETLEQQEQEKIQGRLAKAKENSSSFEQQLAFLNEELESLLKELSQKESLQEQQSQRLSQLQKSQGESRLQLLSLEKDLEALTQARQRMEGTREEQQESLRQLEERIAQLKAQNQEASGSIAALRKQKEEALAQREEAAKAFAALTQQQIALEGELTRLREREKQLISQKERAAALLQQVEEKRFALQGDYDKLIARLYDEYELTRSQAQEVAKPVEDAAGLSRRLTELRGKIRALGSINVEAIDEYKEVSERYRFLQQQIADVENSREELIRLIRDLTARMRELFLQSFSAISASFSSIFAELFGGGKGELVLLDPEDVLQSGIDIRVQPPGKIIKSLTALSGGEKALVAIAIYFSILKVKPSSFVILDEIEAALDEVNVGRYAAYLRKLTGSTQFISITHRRGTMEEADVLYGVTMQEKGVSRLVELDLSQVESKLGPNVAQ